MEAPGFWDDPDISNQKMKELKNLKKVDNKILTIDEILNNIEM